MPCPAQSLRLTFPRKDTQKLMEFHISRKARERYGSRSPFFLQRQRDFANLAACREFAHRMNQVRDVEKHPEQAVHAGQLYAMGLIDEASHVLMARYREQFDPEVMTARSTGLARRWALTISTRCC
jgi:hypothetical protein